MIPFPFEKGTPRKLGSVLLKQLSAVPLLYLRASQPTPFSLGSVKLVAKLVDGISV